MPFFDRFRVIDTKKLSGESSKTGQKLADLKNRVDALDPADVQTLIALQTGGLLGVMEYQRKKFGK